MPKCAGAPRCAEASAVGTGAAKCAGALRCARAQKVGAGAPKRQRWAQVRRSAQECKYAPKVGAGAPKVFTCGCVNIGKLVLAPYTGATGRSAEDIEEQNCTPAYRAR